ncbi:hypothetical protein [Kitasatospora sp. NPDC059571]|uniref:hypothetical protein n=1 Tax=Kitasatospora sp. NPDC059571 TaxID=3346871 RepID=UPI0036BF3B5E
MGSTQHSITTAIYDIDRRLREGALASARVAREPFRLGDEKQLLASLGALVDTVQQLADHLGPQIRSADSRGVLGQAARELRDSARNLHKGERNAPNADAS